MTDDVASRWVSPDRLRPDDVVHESDPEPNLAPGWPARVTRITARDQFVRVCFDNERTWWFGPSTKVRVS